MKTLITYSSLTGNTRRVAEAVFETLKGTKELLPINEVGNPDAYEQIIIGFWVDKGEANEEALNFMNKLTGKTLGIFATLGANPASEHAQKCLSNAAERLIAAGNTVKTTFICQGAVAPDLIARIRAAWKGPVPDDKELRWAEAARHPDETDFANAKAAFAAF